jgi:hypothetical protein
MKLPATIDGTGREPGDQAMQSWLPLGCEGDRGKGG